MTSHTLLQAALFIKSLLNQAPLEVGRLDVPFQIFIQTAEGSESWQNSVFRARLYQHPKRTWCNYHYLGEHLPISRCSFNLRVKIPTPKQKQLNAFAPPVVSWGISPVTYN